MESNYWNFFNLDVDKFNILNRLEIRKGILNNYLYFWVLKYYLVEIWNGREGIIVNVFDNRWFDSVLGFKSVDDCLECFFWFLVCLEYWVY